MLDEQYVITPEELAQFYADYDKWLDEHGEYNDYVDVFEILY